MKPKLIISLLCFALSLCKKNEFKTCILEAFSLYFYETAQFVLSNGIINAAHFMIGLKP